MVLLLWRQIVLLWHHFTMVAPEPQLYQTIVQFHKTIVLPRKLAKGSIHNYLFYYWPLVVFYLRYWELFKKGDNSIQFNKFNCTPCWSQQTNIKLTFLYRLSSSVAFRIYGGKPIISITALAWKNQNINKLWWRTMACFERNLHTQISGGDSILSTIFGGDHVVETTFSFHHPLWHHNR